jgi:hypothetical protein
MQSIKESNLYRVNGTSVSSGVQDHPALYSMLPTSNDFFGPRFQFGLESLKLGYHAFDGQYFDFFKSLGLATKLKVLTFPKPKEGRTVNPVVRSDLELDCTSYMENVKVAV